MKNCGGYRNKYHTPYRRGSSGVAQLEHQINKLASASKLTNDRIEITNQRLKEVREQLLGTNVFYNVTLESANRVHLMVTRKLFLAQSMMNHLNVLLNDLKLLASGTLSPEIVPPKQLRATVYNASVLLKSKFPAFEILTRKTTFYYARGRVNAVRLNNSLLIDMPIYLTDWDQVFNLFEVFNFRAPTPNGQHSSQIVGLPKYVAMGSQRKHFIQFDAKPTIIQGAIKLDNQPIISATNSCMLALFDDSSARIHKWCKSILFREKVDSTITRLTGSLMVLANTPTYQLMCSNGSTITARGCEFCTVKIPCDCAIASETMSLPATLEDCEPDNVMQKNHLVNLVTLVHLFDPPQVESLNGETLLPEQINISLPQFKLSDEKEWDGADTQIKMNLKAAAEAIKDDKVLFQSKQAEILRQLEGLQNWQDFSFTAWRDVALLITFIFIVVLSAMMAFLFYRNAKLSIMLAAAAAAPQAGALNITNFPKFLVYGLAENDNEGPAGEGIPAAASTNLQFDLEYHISKFQTLLLIMLVAILLAILIKLIQSINRRPKSYGSEIYISFFSIDQQVLIKIQDLPDSPERIIFACDRMIESVQITNLIRPNLEITWDLDAVHILVERTLKIKNKIKINPFTARKIRRMIASRDFFIIPLILFKNEFQPMILRKRQGEMGANQGPAHEQATQLGPSEQSSQPPAFGKLYPQLIRPE